ncbi:hypothetical protein [Maritimibacter dapengensis]|uniref:Uncharacterized protein n=1 Tax=Maritimibacter dapengensis TaxID=2836868 RepID=A0ABS6T617_9RHOB|nr:hypothetical protein [Maritimibacter dapengensis]MBV7380594.1 hypothetical protein [Maritimibacter dapengensis]
MGHGASFNVIAIDDTPASDELVQEHLLAASGVARLRNVMLVWRPVLAVLHALDQKLVCEGQTVGVVTQSAEGVSLQSFDLRPAHGKSTRVVAPERRRTGRSVSGPLGFSSLVRTARYLALGEDGLSARTAHRARARSVGNFALGLPVSPEVLRQQNGDWDLVDLSDEVWPTALTLDETLPDFSECDAVLLETVAEGAAAEALHRAVAQVSKSPLIRLTPYAVARGALVAARRLGSGDPVYFDFLPRISTIVFSGNSASNFDLIDAKETLEAGRLYRSPVPAELAIPGGQNQISVYLRKDAAPWPRKAKLELDKPLRSNTPVSLWVEQKPAAGRARILMEARDLGRSFTIDWDEATEEKRSWEDIIDSQHGTVSVPSRLVLPCGLDAWHDSERADGLFTLLDKETDRRNPDWDTLAAKLSQRPFGKYCISSDGDLPDEIDPEYVEHLDRLTERAIDVTQRRLRGEVGPGTEDNAALKFLTWQFRRCPEPVAGWLIDCIEADDRTHPFVHYAASWVLVFQGLGRIIKDEKIEQKAIETLLSTKIEDWVWNRQSAGMAFLLSRSDTAPFLLNRYDVERLGRRAIADFKRNLHGEYTMFNYAPFLMAGLLRWRRKEPAALVAGTDPLADEFLKIILRVEDDMTGRDRSSPNFARRRSKFLPILKDLKAEVQGNGSNPDLLLDIYSVSSSK